jgi:hypothetical protein
MALEAGTFVLLLCLAYAAGQGGDKYKNMHMHMISTFTRQALEYFIRCLKLLGCLHFQDSGMP